MELMKKQHAYHIEHGYKWITEYIAEDYQKKYKSLLQNGVSEVDASWKLGSELQSIYGVSQIEAINILRGFHVRDYVERYERIRKFIPIQKKKIEQI